MTTDALEVGVLSRLDCLALLRTISVGRVAFTYRAMPAIVPVSFALVRDAIVVVSQDRSLLDYADDRAVVAFQADRGELGDRDSWSVMCVGRIRRLGAADQDPQMLGIDSELLHGRRFLRESFTDVGFLAGG